MTLREKRKDLPKTFSIGNEILNMKKKNISKREHTFCYIEYYLARGDIRELGVVSNQFKMEN